jgi:hypothetical protein
MRHVRAATRTFAIAEGVKARLLTLWLMSQAPCFSDDRWGGANQLRADTVATSAASQCRQAVAAPSPESLGEQAGRHNTTAQKSIAVTGAIRNTGSR